MPIQVNGKMKGTIEISVGVSQEEIENMVYSTGKVEKSQVKKIIYIPNRIINFIV